MIPSSSSPARRRLPNRRLHVTEEIAAADGMRITATVGFDPYGDGDGAPAELFLSGGEDGKGAKVGSVMAAILEDACVVISVALQHGIPVEALRRSVSSDRASPIGAALELVASFCSQLEGSDGRDRLGTHRDLVGEHRQHQPARRLGIEVGDHRQVLGARPVDAAAVPQTHDPSDERRVFPADRPPRRRPIDDLPPADAEIRAQRRLPPRAEQVTP